MSRLAAHSAHSALQVIDDQVERGDSLSATEDARVKLDKDAADTHAEVLLHVAIYNATHHTTNNIKTLPPADVLPCSAPAAVRGTLRSH